jgi:hypothetical protein
MAEPVGFDGSNHLYLAPDGMPQEECCDLPVFSDDEQTVSCWRLTKEELEEVNRTGVVWLSILSHVIYPHKVSGTALVQINGKPSKAEPCLPRAPRIGVEYNGE